MSVHCSPLRTRNLDVHALLGTLWVALAWLIDHARGRCVVNADQSRCKQRRWSLPEIIGPPRRRELGTLSQPTATPCSRGWWRRGSWRIHGSRRARPRAVPDRRLASWRGGAGLVEGSSRHGRALRATNPARTAPRSIPALAGSAALRTLAYVKPPLFVWGCSGARSRGKELHNGGGSPYTHPRAESNDALREVRALAIEVTRMPTDRTSKGHWAVWLLIPLLVLAAGGRSICWCTDADSHCAEGAADVPKVACCHGHGQPAEEHSHGPERQSPDPSSPGDGCCCVDTGVSAALVPEVAPPGHHAATAWVAASFVFARYLPRQVRPSIGRPRPSQENKPPLFVVNCTFRC